LRISSAVEDWQSGAGLSRAEQSGAELDSVDQGWVELDSIEQGWVELSRAVRKWHGSVGKFSTAHALHVHRKFAAAV
jgi:hypothetical protein